MGLKSSEKKKKRKERLNFGCFPFWTIRVGERERERGRERRGYYHESSKRKEERLLTQQISGKVIIQEMLQMMLEDFILLSQR